MVLFKGDVGDELFHHARTGNTEFTLQYDVTEGYRLEVQVLNAICSDRTPDLPPKVSCREGMKLI